MARPRTRFQDLTDAELFDRLADLVERLTEKVTRRGWLQAAVQQHLSAVREVLDEVEARYRLKRQAERERICQRRFGRLTDDELAKRIAAFEHDLVSAMEVSGPAELSTQMLSEQWRCACLVASKRPALWQRLLAEGRCTGALAEDPGPYEPPSTSSGSDPTPNA